ncbi:hypothetical protein [Paenibacillus sp. FSL R7-0128]|uniref:hypothetical protein n=1 Tax=Paenibacillus sp. FSL R7-0128 TaxID=2954529 RepID=UPI0030F84C05
MSTQTDELKTLLHAYIIYPHLTVSVQRVLEGLEATPNVLNRLYNASGTLILRRITADLHDNRLALNRAGLHVLRNAERNGFIHIEFTRKGSATTDVYTVAREVIRKEMGAKMAQYIVEFGALVGHK